MIELEDYVNDETVNIYPPQPQPFPQRKPVSQHVEHQVIEEELDSLREEIKAVHKQNNSFKQENERLKQLL